MLQLDEHDQIKSATIIRELFGLHVPFIVADVSPPSPVLAFRGAKPFGLTGSCLVLSSSQDPPQNVPWPLRTSWEPLELPRDAPRDLHGDLQGPQGHRMLGECMSQTWERVVFWVRVGGIGP